MLWHDPLFITESDLGIAYRKAKVDIFYERSYPYLRDIAEYEKHLSDNLSSLFQRLTCNDLSWMRNKQFVGSWSVIPKSIESDSSRDDNAGSCLYSDPDLEWKRQGTQATAYFRLIGKHSIDFHIVSALWIMKVGHYYDACLGSEAYGARLRRCNSSDDVDLGSPSRNSMGTFKPYLAQYRAWRENGLAAMMRGLEENRRVVAITADVKHFYHMLSPQFILDPKFTRLFDLQRMHSGDEYVLTKALLQAIESWASETPLHRGASHMGLPVGLSASPLIANMALAELDRAIIREIQPLYYGRYVDDILVVLDDTHHLNTLEDIWSHISERLGQDIGIRLTRGSSENEFSVQYKPSYHENSVLEFIGKKQKAFVLEGVSGRAFISHVRNQINRQSSEWRMLPELSESPTTIPATLITAWTKDHNSADNLRTADHLSISRAAFAVILRDFEAFAQDLSPDAWMAHRRAFFSIICSHFIALPHLFDYSGYLSRLFGLAVACHDLESAGNILARIEICLHTLQSSCSIRLAAGIDHDSDRVPLVESWQRHLYASFQESLLQSLSLSHRENESDILSLWDRISIGMGPHRGVYANLECVARDMYFRDLGRTAFRMRYLYYDHREEWDTADLSSVKIQRGQIPSVFAEMRIKDIYEFLRRIGKEEPATLPLVFPTRPFSISELTILTSDLSHHEKYIYRWAGIFRGYNVPINRPCYDKKSNTLQVPLGREMERIRIALGCLETTENSWVASVCRRPEPDATRYSRICRLVNAVLSSSLRPDYLVLPELSVPASWYSRLAAKCMHRGISLIAGVEYIHNTANRTVANQIWASLLTDYNGFSVSVIYRQDKERPSIHEAEALNSKAGIRLQPHRSPAKPILNHGNIYLAFLVCSELTNMDFRARLRGNIDILVIPEWNQDTETFGTIVEAAAADIHAFIVQCNNRMYGDSRIRAPGKEPWTRDVVRVKGGDEDYYVIGTLEVKELRLFQSDHISNTDGLFKPVPDGYEISVSRRTYL